MTVDPETLMRQAPMTVDLYADKGLEYIVSRFGLDPMTNANLAPFMPFLAAYVTACAKDYDTGMRSRAAEIAEEGAAGTMEKMVEAVQDIADQLKALGVGNAATHLGAIEFHAMTLKDSIADLASAVSHDRG